MALSPEKFERLKTLVLQQGKQAGGVIGGKGGEGFIEETGKDIISAFKKPGEKFFKAGEKVSEELFKVKDTKTVEEAVRRPITIGAELFRGGARGFGEAVIGGLKIITPKSIEEQASGIMEEIGKKIGEQPITQELISKYNALPPDTKQDVDNILGYAEGLGEILGTKGGTEAIRRLSKPIVETAIDAVEKAALVTVRGTRGIKSRALELTDKIIPTKIREINKKLNPKDATEATNSLKTIYKDSFVSDKPSINNKLDDLASTQSLRGNKVTPDDLLRGLAETGYVPRVEGKLAKFDDAFDDINLRQERIVNAIDGVLETIPELTTLDELKNWALGVIKKSPQLIGQRSKSGAELNRFFEDFALEFGDKGLSAKDVNRIRVAMNQRTKAFTEDVFVQDVADSIADAARARLDDIAPSVRLANEQYGRLVSIKKTMDIFHNKPIDVGILGSQLGRYLAVMGAGQVGLGVTGPGGLVIAGIIAHFGGDAFAQLLRNKKFNQKLLGQIVNAVKKDDEIVERLIKEADSANKEILERILLPVKAGASNAGVIKLREKGVDLSKITPI